MPEYAGYTSQDHVQHDQKYPVFLQHHHGHRLQLLKKRPGRLCADRPAWDPFRTAYEEVTDGQTTFLLKSWRTDIAEPRQYVLLQGHLDQKTTLFLSPEPLRSSLGRELSLSAERLTTLVRLLCATVTRLSPEELIPAYSSAQDPRVSFMYLAESHISLFIRRCCETGFSAEKERLLRFFRQNREEEELTIEVRQDSIPSLCPTR